MTFTLMLGSEENGEERKLPQKNEVKYNFSPTWFSKEKVKERKMCRKL